METQWSSPAAPRGPLTSAEERPPADAPQASMHSRDAVSTAAVGGVSPPMAASAAGSSARGSTAAEPGGVSTGIAASAAPPLRHADSIAPSAEAAETKPDVRALMPVAPRLPAMPDDMSQISHQWSPAASTPLAGAATTSSDSGGHAGDVQPSLPAVSAADAARDVSDGDRDQGAERAVLRVANSEDSAGRRVEEGAGDYVGDCAARRRTPAVQAEHSASGALPANQPSGVGAPAGDDAINDPRQPGDGGTVTARKGADAGSDGASIAEVDGQAAAQPLACLTASAEPVPGAHVSPPMTPVSVDEVVSALEEAPVAVAPAPPAGKRRRKLGSNRAVRLSLDYVPGTSQWPVTATSLRVRHTAVVLMLSLGSASAPSCLAWRWQITA